MFGKKELKITVRWGCSMNIKTYLKVWQITASNSLQEAFINRWTNAVFMFGKFIRLFMTLLLLWLVRGQVSQLGSYNTDQMVVFFLTYQFIDTFAQIIYRGVYLFSSQVRTGEFDFLLAKPISPLFRSLTGKPDINDFFFLFPSTAISIYIISQLNLNITITSSLMFLALLINSFLIVTAFHIIVLVVGILTTEVDGVIWMYRDLTRMGQFPISIYLEPLRSVLFFLIPVGMMVTIPAEVLIGVQPSYSIGLTTTIGVASILISFSLWRWSLQKYSSASS